MIKQSFLDAINLWHKDGFITGASAGDGCELIRD